MKVNCRHDKVKKPVLDKGNKSLLLNVSALVSCQLALLVTAKRFDPDQARQNFLP